ncbi:MAG: hypothetical protein WC879_13595 [Melioribacteraceae bacterium]
MKTLIRLLIVLPLLTLGGCYTQIAFRDYSPKDSRYESQEDEYAYEDQADSNYYNENDYDYRYQDSYVPGYRRFLGSYYPSLGFSYGLGYNSYYYSLFGWDSPYWYWRYNSIWNYGYYGYNYGYPYYWNNYNSHWNNYAGSNVKYRNNVNTRTRDNDGQRGRGVIGGSDRGRTGTNYSTRDRTDRANDVDLSRVRVSRDANNRNDGTRVSSPRNDNPSKRDVNTRTRERSSNRESNSAQPATRERDASRGRSESAQPATRERSERQAPSYSPPPSFRSSEGSRSSSSGSSSGGSRSGGSSDSGRRR